MYCCYYLRFKLRAAVGHIGSSFSWKINIHESRRFVGMPICSLNFIIIFPYQISFNAYEASNSLIWVHNPNESFKNILFRQPPQFFIAILLHCWVLRTEKGFSTEKWLFAAKVLIKCHSVKQNFVFVVLQSEVTTNRNKNWLIRHVE